MPLPILPTTNPNQLPGLPDPQLSSNYVLGPQSQYLFNRQWSFGFSSALVGPTQPGVANTPTKVYSMQAVGGRDGSQETNLRVEFDIVKTLVSSANKATIKIYNLNDQSRNQNFKGMLLTLWAGYANNNLQSIATPIFSGNISGRVAHKRQGPDIVSTFECGQGEQQIYFTFMNKSYPTGTTFMFIITDIVRNYLKLPFGVTSGLPNVSLGSPFVASGGVKQVLDNLASRFGLLWSIQNGAFQMIPIDSHNGQTATLVSQTTGMIGVPSAHPGGDSIVSVQSLINPTLIPGSPISLQSQSINGIFRINTAHYEGDSRGPKWQVSMECVPVAATAATIDYLGAIQ